jgi:ABC-type transporter Mla subunit MlaD
VFCGVIVFIASYYAIRFYVSFRPIYKQMKLAVTEINKSKRDKLAFPEYYYAFKGWIESQAYLADAWREYEETLLIPGQDFDDDREVILNTHLTSTYFNQRNILWHYIDIRFYNALPNILTGLGIVGTFVGLSAGIYLAAPGLNSDSINDAKAALNILLDGAALAFTTSIIGLSTSLLFSVFEKKLIHKFARSCQKLVSEIDARVEYFSAERLANKSLEESKKQSDALQTFANDLAVNLGKVIEQQVTQPMVQAINDLREDQKAASDETLTKLIEEFSSSITGAAGEEMKAFASTIETLSVNMEQQVASLSNGQKEMQEASQKAVEDMAAALSDGSDKITEGIEDAVKALSLRVAKTMETVTDQLEIAANKFSDKLKQSTEDFDAVVSKLKSIGEEYNSLSETNQDLFDKIMASLSSADALISSANEAHGKFIQSGEQFEQLVSNTVNASEKIANTSESINSATSQIASAQEDIKQSWQDYEKRFGGIDASLETVFTSINHGLSSYAQKTDEYILGLDKHAAEVVQSLATAATEISDSIEALDDALGSKSGEFKDTIDVMTQQAARNLVEFRDELAKIKPVITVSPQNR